MQSRTQSGQANRGGEIWKRRILRAMRGLSGWVLERPGTWLFGADENVPPTLTKPQWIPVLSRLMLESTTAAGAMAQVQALVQHDALTPEMQRTLKTALLGRPGIAVTDIPQHLRPESRKKEMVSQDSRERSAP